MCFCGSNPGLGVCLTRILSVELHPSPNCLVAQADPGLAMEPSLSANYSPTSVSKFWDWVCTSLHVRPCSLLFLWCGLYWCLCLLLTNGGSGERPVPHSHRNSQVLIFLLSSEDLEIAACPPGQESRQGGVKSLAWRRSTYPQYFPKLVCVSSVSGLWD